jgi:hypothetical protein
MPLSFTIKGIEPNGLNAYPDAVRLLYWSWVTQFALKAKDRDLAAGLDAFGEPLKPISKETRKHRKSAMTPSGKGDPSAPPLSPGRKLSRVRSLLAGRALLDRCEIWWRFDPFTHASFGRILTFQQEQGRDVFGLSDESTEEVRLAALRKWRQWLTTGQVVPLELEGRRVVAPMAATGTTGPPVRAGELPGHAPTKFAVFGIGGEPGTGAPVRGFSEAEFKAFYRQTMPANVQARPGTDYNRLLRHIWGEPPARGRGPAVPRPPRPPKPVPTPPVAPLVPPLVPPPVSPPVFMPPLVPPRVPVAAKPVSAGLDVLAKGETGKAIKASIEAIDSVHGDGSLPKIPIKQTNTTNRNGAFWRDHYGKPIKIDVSAKGDHLLMTTTHEVGHFLDYEGIPKTQPDMRHGYTGTMYRDFRKESQFAEWVKAIDESEAVKKLRDVQTKSQVVLGTVSTLQGPQKIMYNIDKNHAKYLNTDVELWARSYAQYITHKSQNEVMRKELTQHQESNYGKVYGSQWDHADFLPIAQAFDNLFTALGWLK